MQGDRRDGWFLQGTLIALMALALVGQLISGALAPRSAVIAPIATELKGQLVLTGDRSLVNINAADADLLMMLPGIGPALSARIIEYREANGPLETIDQLTEIKGIGPALVERLRDRVCLSAPD